MDLSIFLEKKKGTLLNFYKIVPFLFFLPLCLLAEVPKIRGILLTTSQEKEISFSEKAKGVFFQDLEPFPLLQQELEEKFLHQPLTLDYIKEIKQCILATYEKEGDILPVVEIPPQSITSGNIIFTITGAKAGNIKAPTLFKKRFHLKEGMEIHREELINHITWFNQNPFRLAQAIFSPGELKKTTDIQILVRERFPLRFFSGTDTADTLFTQENHFFIGVTWGDAFFVGDLLTFQYTTSFDLQRYRASSVHYTSFLPCKHTLVIYGGYTNIHSEQIDFTDKGENIQASLRYKIPLSSTFSQELSLGFDYKFLNTNQLFRGSTEKTPPFPSDRATNLTQLVAEYSLSQEKGFSFKVEVLTSPARWLPYQNNKRYNLLHEGSISRYLYSKIQLGGFFFLPYGSAFQWLLKGQLSTQALLPSEQFSLGGYDTVRGYPEWGFSADHAICTNVEIHSPHLFLFHKEKEDFYFLAFIDGGGGYNLSPQSSEPMKWLLGIGPGLRYHRYPYCSIRLDYGFALRALEKSSSLGRLHLGLNLSY